MSSDPNTFTTKPFKGPDSHESHVLPFKVNQHGAFEFSVTQRNKSDVKYSGVRIFVFQKLSDNDYVYLDGCFNQGNEVNFLNVRLMNNVNYLLVVEVDWIKETPEKVIDIKSSKGPEPIAFTEESKLTSDHLLDLASK